MNINQRILNVYNLSKQNVNIVEILEEIEIDLLKTNDLDIEAFEIYDMLKYKYEKQYAADIDRTFRNLQI